MLTKHSTILPSCYRIFLINPPGGLFGRGNYYVKFFSQRSVNNIWFFQPANGFYVVTRKILGRKQKCGLDRGQSTLSDGEFPRSIRRTKFSAMQILFSKHMGWHFWNNPLGAVLSTLITHHLSLITNRPISDKWWVWVFYQTLIKNRSSLITYQAALIITTLRVQFPLGSWTFL